MDPAGAICFDIVPAGGLGYVISLMESRLQDIRTRMSDATLPNNERHLPKTAL